EPLDDAGAHANDARDRARALRAAGARGRLAILDGRQERGRHAEESDTEESTSRAVVQLSNDRHGRRALERMIVREAIDCVIVATADPSRVTWPNMPPSVARCVWPTGTGARSRRAFGRSTT